MLRNVFLIWRSTGQFAVSWFTFDWGESDCFLKCWHLFLYFSFFFPSYSTFSVSSSICLFASICFFLFCPSSMPPDVAYKRKKWSWFGSGKLGLFPLLPSLFLRLNCVSLPFSNTVNCPLSWPWRSWLRRLLWVISLIWTVWRGAYVLERYSPLPAPFVSCSPHFSFLPLFFFT